MIYHAQFTPDTDERTYELFHDLFAYHLAEVERLITLYARIRQNEDEVKKAYILTLQSYIEEMDGRIAAARLAAEEEYATSLEKNDERSTHG